MKTLGSLICLLSLVCASGLAGSAPGWSVDGRSQAQLLRKSYDSAATGKERDYFLYLPAGYFTEPGRTWPVILFLHGGLLSGDGKEDLDRVLNVGPLYEAWIQTRDLPFAILYPQLARFDQPAQTVVVSRRSENGPPPPRKYGPRPEQPMARESTGKNPRWGKKGCRGVGGRWKPTCSTS